MKTLFVYKHVAVFESDREAAREVTSIEPVEVAAWKLYGVCVDEKQRALDWVGGRGECETVSREKDRKRVFSVL